MSEGTRESVELNPTVSPGSFSPEQRKSMRKVKLEHIGESRSKEALRNRCCFIQALRHIRNGVGAMTGVSIIGNKLERD